MLIVFLFPQSWLNPQSLQSEDFSLYCSMVVYIIKSGKEYTVYVPAPDPNTKQAMDIIRQAIETLELPEEEVAEYIVSWSREIKSKQ